LDIALKPFRIGEGTDCANPLPPLLGPGNKIRDSGDLVGSKDQVQTRKTAEQALTFLLGHATADRKYESGITVFFLLQTAQEGIDLILGLLPDGAGVQDD
jgi:hypothetical protein